MHFLPFAVMAETSEQPGSNATFFLLLHSHLFISVLMARQRQAAAGEDGPLREPEVMMLLGKSLESRNAMSSDEGARNFVGQ